MAQTMGMERIAAMDTWERISALQRAGYMPLWGVSGSNLSAEMWAAPDGSAVLFEVSRWVETSMNWTPPRVTVYGPGESTPDPDEWR